MRERMSMNVQNVIASLKNENRKYMHENDRQGQYVHLQHFIHVEWQIQDFPEGVAASPEGSANLLFGIMFAENYMKVKKN